jgi:hypothetical protein
MVKNSPNLIIAENPITGEFELSLWASLDAMRSHNTLMKWA